MTDSQLIDLAQATLHATKESNSLQKYGLFVAIIALIVLIFQTVLIYYSYIGIKATYVVNVELLKIEQEKKNKYQ